MSSRYEHVSTGRLVCFVLLSELVVIVLCLECLSLEVLVMYVVSNRSSVDYFVVGLSLLISIVCFHLLFLIGISCTSLEYFCLEEVSFGIRGRPMTIILVLRHSLNSR